MRLRLMRAFVHYVCIVRFVHQPAFFFARAAFSVIQVGA
jgi:hypothetical protein